MPGDIVSAELRGELDELRKRIDDIEERLETRIAAAEQKQAVDFDTIQAQLRRIDQAVAALPSRIGNLEYELRANHMAQIHLWGETARFMKMPERRVTAAQRRAEKVMKAAHRG